MFVEGIFTWWLQYFSKNRAILVQKLLGEKKFSVILKDFKKKFPWPLSSRGGGVRPFMAWPLVEEFFFAAS